MSEAAVVMINVTAYGEILTCVVSHCSQSGCH